MVRLSLLFIPLLCSCSPAEPMAVADPALQKARKVSLEKLSPYIHRIDDELDHLIVTEHWYALPFEDKQLIASGAASYCFHLPAKVPFRSGDILLIKDYRTGKSIGMFSYQGLQIY